MQLKARRLDEAEKKRAARKARAGSTSTLGSEHTMSDLRERLSCSDRTPQPHLHLSPTQHFELNKSRGHLRLRRTNIMSVRSHVDVLNNHSLNFTKFSLHCTSGRASGPPTTMQYVMYFRFRR